MSIQQIRVASKMFVVAVCSLMILNIAATDLPAQKVTLTFQYCEDQSAYAIPAVEEFNKLHPEIKIVGEPFPWLGSFEMMTTRFIAGQEAPLLNLHCSWVERFSELGWLANLNPRLHEIDTEDFWPDIMQIFNYKGKQFALPTFADIFGYIYHVDMFEEAGLDPNKPPQDWAELVAVLKKLTKAEKDQYGLIAPLKAGDHVGAVFVNVFIRQNKGRVLNKNYTRCLLNENAPKEAVQFVSDLFHKHKVCTPASFEYYHSEASTAFAMKETASMMNSSMMAALMYKKNPNLHIYSAPFPKGKQWKGARTYGWSIATSASAKYQDEAWKFVKFLLSPKIVREIIIEKGKTLGPRISVAKTSPMLHQQPFKSYIEAMEKGYGWVDPPIKEWNEIKLCELDYFLKVFLKKATVEEAMEEATKEIDVILKERRES